MGIVGNKSTTKSNLESILHDWNHWNLDDGIKVSLNLENGILGIEYRLNGSVSNNKIEKVLENLANNLTRYMKRYNSCKPKVTIYVEDRYKDEAQKLLREKCAEYNKDLLNIFDAARYIDKYAFTLGGLYSIIYAITHVNEILHDPKAKVAAIATIGSALSAAYLISKAYSWLYSHIYNEKKHKNLVDACSIPIEVVGYNPQST